MMRPQMKAKTGELWKADPQGRNWKKRFFVLGQGKISYFLSRDAHMSKPDRPKGYFLVADIDDIVDRPHAMVDKPPTQCGFYIQVRGRGRANEVVGARRVCVWGGVWAHTGGRVCAPQHLLLSAGWRGLYGEE